jgi:transposase
VEDVVKAIAVGIVGVVGEFCAERLAVDQDTYALARFDSALRRWGQGLRARIGFKRAVVAVARKLAVVLHAMWKNDRPFDTGLLAMPA